MTYDFRKLERDIIHCHYKIQFLTIFIHGITFTFMLFFLKKKLKLSKRSPDHVNNVIKNFTFEVSKQHVFKRKKGVQFGYVGLVWIKNTRILYYIVDRSYKRHVLNLPPDFSITRGSN